MEPFVSAEILDNVTWYAQREVAIVSCKSSVSARGPFPAVLFAGGLVDKTLAAWG